MHAFASRAAASLATPTSETECRVVGTTPAATYGELFQLLKGVSGTSGRVVHVYERRQRADGPPRVEIRLQRSLLASGAAADDTTSDLRLFTSRAGFRHSSPLLVARPTRSKPRYRRWTIRHEAAVLRGNLKDLPVAVLSVTETDATGPDVPGFWEAFGLGSASESMREGIAFQIVSADSRVTVRSRSQARHAVCPRGSETDLGCLSLIYRGLKACFR